MAFRYPLIISSILWGFISLAYPSPKVNTEEPKNPNKSSPKKSFDQWIDLLRSGTEEERRLSIEALKTLKPIPKSAIPALIEVVETCRETVSYPALRLIQDFGTDAKECVPTLLRLLKEKAKNPQNPYSYQEIAATLAKIDTQPHLEVTRILIFCGEGKRMDRSREFWTYVYRFPIPVTEQLLEIVREDEKSRHQALIHLTKYRQATLGKQKSLFDLVEPKIHLVAQLELLLGAGSAIDQQVFPTLIQLDPQMGVDHASLVARCLEQNLLSPSWVGEFLKPKAKEMLPTMIQGIRKPTPRQVYQAVLTQWPREMVWPSIRQVLHDRDPQMRQGAVNTMGFILSDIRYHPRSPGAQTIRKEIHNELLVAIKDEYPKVRLDASMHLASYFPEERDHLVRPLIGLIGHPEEEVQWKAIQTLGDLGPGGYSALPALFQSLTKLEHYSRLLALNAIVSIDVSKSDRILEDVRKELKKKNSITTYHQKILQTIKQMGPRAKDLTSDLLVSFEPQPTWIALLGIDTLDRIAPEQPEFQLQGLRQILKKIPRGKNPEYQARLITQRLLRLGEKANGLVPALQELRPQLDAEAQAVFSLALFAIDPKNRIKYAAELRDALLQQHEDLNEAFIESPAVLPYLKDLMPIFFEVLKRNPNLTYSLVNIFREIGKPMRDFLPQLKAFENQLATQPQKDRWNKYVKELESMKE